MFPSERDPKPMLFSSNLTELGLTGFNFKSCTPVDCRGAIPKFFVAEPDNDGVVDDSLENFDSLSIFSGRFVDALNRAGIGGVQYVSIEVKTTNGEQLSGYCIVNALIAVENALDLEKSYLLRFNEDAKSVERRGKVTLYIPVLKQVALGEHDVFRLKFDENLFDVKYDRSFIVSERVRNVFVKNKFKGIVFSKIETV
jgi:hypothetical protein